MRKHEEQSIYIAILRLTRFQPFFCPKISCVTRAVLLASCPPRTLQSFPFCTIARCENITLVESHVHFFESGSIPSFPSSPKNSSNTNNNRFSTTPSKGLNKSLYRFSNCSKGLNKGETSCTPKIFS